MHWTTLLALILTAVLIGCLITALLKPEKF